MKTHFLVIATAIVGSLVHNAQASALEVQVNSQAVPYGDLDLTQAADAKALYKRIKFAARNVCGPRGLSPLDFMPTTVKCVAGATARAVADVNAPALTSYHSSKTGDASRSEVTTLVRADLDESTRIPE